MFSVHFADDENRVSIVSRFSVPHWLFCDPGPSSPTWTRGLATRSSSFKEIRPRPTEWFTRSDLPKLFINADPGAQIVWRIRDFCRCWPQPTGVAVPGIQFIIQED